MPSPNAIPFMTCDLTKPVLSTTYNLTDTAGVLHTYPVALNIKQFETLSVFGAENFYENGFPTVATFTDFVEFLFPGENNPHRALVLGIVVPDGVYAMQQFISGTVDALMKFSKVQATTLLQPNRAFEDIVINMDYVTNKPPVTV